MKALASIFAMALLITSCTGEVVGEYSTHQCYYMIDFQYGHTASPLYASLNSNNTFCVISTSPIGSTAYKLTAQLQGATAHEESITEEMNTRPSRQLGLAGSLIIGRSSFQDGALYVFDRQCPNCYNDKRRANYPLSFSNAQSMHCASCGRTYSLLSGGVVSAGDNGEKLFRYKATYTSLRLSISNP
jgi:hypothetical protein